MSISHDSPNKKPRRKSQNEEDSKQNHNKESRKDREKEKKKSNDESEKRETATPKSSSPQFKVMRPSAERANMSKLFPRSALSSQKPKINFDTNQDTDLLGSIMSNMDSPAVKNGNN